MPEYSYVQSFVKLEGENFKPVLDDFQAIMKKIGLWNELYANAFDEFTWIIEDGGFVYSTTTGLPASVSSLSNVLIKPMVLGISNTDENLNPTNYLACEFLMEAEDLRSLRMWRYYPSSFDLIRALAREMFNAFKNSIIYFTDEAQDGQDFEHLCLKKDEPLWKFDYALVPIELQNIYANPPQSHQVFSNSDFFEVFFKDKWEVKSILQLNKAK